MGRSRYWKLTADEVEKLEVPHLISKGDNTFEQATGTDGQPSLISAAFLKGKHFKSNGIWITPYPGQGEGWKNRKYIEFFQGCGVDFPIQDGKTKVMEVEESDIVGMPVLVKLDNETYTNADGEEKLSIRVMSTLPWKDGTRLDAAEMDEDIPF